jgi:hypothetical protein
VRHQGLLVNGSRPSAVNVLQFAVGVFHSAVGGD